MQWQDLSQASSAFLFKIIIFVQAFFQLLGIVPAPCEKPLEYTLGTIDSRFEVSEAEILSAVQEAEKIWEDASGKNLFLYNPEQGLAVSFVYDERQERTQAGKELEEKLDALNLDESENSIKSGVKNYETNKANYEKAKDSYEQNLKSYNGRVERVNKRGGATDVEQQELQKDYDDLQEQFQNLESLRLVLNKDVESTNKSITDNRTRVEQYNSQVNTFQDLYGGEGEVFDQGVYTGKDITIYQYDDRNRLILVLAHEMGHALGIDHSEDSRALMYYLMRDQDINDITLSASDIEAVTAVCQQPKLFGERGE